MSTRERIGRLHDYLSALAQEVHARPVRHVGDYDLTVAPSDSPTPSDSRSPPAAAASSG